MQTDNNLGIQIQTMLALKGLETPRIGVQISPEQQIRDIEHHMSSIMNILGLDLTDDSLIETPKRIAKMYIEEVFAGLDYANFPKMTVIENKMKANEIICVKDIKLYSACEHHFVPIMGVAHIAYIPKNRIVGLSKLNRLVEFFARRPQVQERLTEQVAASLQFLLETDDVAVIMQAEHLCVKWRGVQDPNSQTITSKMLGRFDSNPTLRAELLSLIKN